MIETAQLIETFTHVRIVLAMIVSLGIARILSGVANFIQHPKRNRVSLLHLLWVASMLLELILFWWWDVRTARETDWTFGAFIFQISYAIILFLMAALLFPDNIAEYKGYQDFFIQRRYWFFGLLASTWILDFSKTIIEGSKVSTALMLHASTAIMVCIIAISFRSPKMQILVVLLYISRQIYSM